MKATHKRTMEEYLQEHPYLKETAELHSAMQTVFEEVVEVVEFPSEEQMSESLKDGLPLLQEMKLQQKVVKEAAKVFGKVLTRLCKIDAPELLQESMKSLKAWARQAKVSEIRAYFDFLLRQEDAEIRAFAQEKELNEVLLRTVGWNIIRAIVPADYKKLGLWDKVSWRRNYCPVCGRRPVLAQLRKEKNGKARYLSCDGCHTQWQYARVGCSYCGNEDLNKMHILALENDDRVRIDVCDACNAYLKTYCEEGEEHIYLEDWATLTLDLLGEEQGIIKKGSIVLSEK